MKKTFLLAAITCIIFSCKKSTSSPGGGTAYYVSSVKSVSPESQIVDSLQYDVNHNITEFIQYSYDLSGSGAVDSIAITFTYAQNSNVPLTYTYADIANGITNDVHDLYYDGNGRIIKDTSLSGSGFVNYFSYPNNAVASTVLFEGNYNDNQLDTSYTSNGNITSEVFYYSNYTPTDTLTATLAFGYSSLANPLYYSSVSPSIGALLNIEAYDGAGDIIDFYSKQLFDQLTVTEPGTPSEAVTLNWTTDGLGRASEGTYTGIPGTYIQYNYY